MHQTIRRVTEDMERFRFNVMLAALMEYTNYLPKVLEGGSVYAQTWTDAVSSLILLIAPSAPHLAEELWIATGHSYSVHNQLWPKWDAELARDEEITLVIQVNGKVRDKVTVPASITEPEARELAINRDRIRQYISSPEKAKIIYVPGRLINIVGR